MNRLDIELILLLLISVSSVALLYGGYLEYLRSQHLRRIKRSLSQDVGDERLLLERRRSVKRLSLLQKLEQQMLYAGITLPLWLAMLFGALIIAAIGSLFMLFVKHWSGYIIGLPFGVLIIYMGVSAVIMARKREFNRAFAIAISVLVKMMKTGVGFEQAMHKSVEVSNSKLFKEIFESFFKEKNTIGEEEAFANLEKFVDSKELRIFALAVKIGRASGGRFSNTLEKVEQTLVYRKGMQERVDVMTREGAVGSYIVAGIAVFLYFALDGNFGGKLHEYYMDSEYGRFQLVAIFLWVFLGLMVNKMIIRIKQ